MIVCVPATRLFVVNLACPFASSTAVNEFPASKKTTLPVGTIVPSPPVTVAVS